MTGAGTYLILFYISVDLSTYTFNSGGQVFIMLAADENIVIGRGAGTAFTTNNPPGTNNQFYFGMWPFNGGVVVDGQPIETYKLTINAAGSYTNVRFDASGNPSIINNGAQYGNNMIGGSGPRNIFVGGGAEILDPARLPYTP